MTTTSRTRQTPRVEDNALVRGAGHFMDDPRLPNTAYAAFVRSTHAHARVVAVNTDEARKTKKVLAVLTAAGHQGGNFGTVSRHPPCRARRQADHAAPAPARGRQALHVGEPVAMVVAETASRRQDAAELVEVEYEPLTPVIDARAALNPGAPQV